MHHKMPEAPRLHRGFSWAVHDAHGRQEGEAHERLLPNGEGNDEEDQEEVADEDGLYPPDSCWTSDNPNPPNPHAGLPVYMTIHRSVKLRPSI